MRPRPKSVSLTKVSKAVRVPSHPLARRLRRFLETVDAVHMATNLKPVAVEMNPFVQGAVFDAYTGTGPYTIYLNPHGSHVELSLLHEVGHFLEWQCIPKSVIGPRNFSSDLTLSDWLDAVLMSPSVQQMMLLRDRQDEGSSGFQELNYALRPAELWARAYCQYVAVKSSSMPLVQQIAAQNNAAASNTAPLYWPREQFISVEGTMDVIFRSQGWMK